MACHCIFNFFLVFMVLTHIGGTTDRKSNDFSGIANSCLEKIEKTWQGIIALDCTPFILII